MDSKEGGGEKGAGRYENMNSKVGRSRKGEGHRGVALEYSAQGLNKLQGRGEQMPFLDP